MEELLTFAIYVGKYESEDRIVRVISTEKDGLFYCELDEIPEMDMVPLRDTKEDSYLFFESTKNLRLDQIISLIIVVGVQNEWLAKDFRRYTQVINKYPELSRHSQFMEDVLNDIIEGLNS